MSTQTRRSFLQSSAAMFAALGVRLDFSQIDSKGIDLSKFCDTDSGHWDLTKPWTIAGHRYACNHHIIARVPTGDADDVRFIGPHLTRQDESRVPRIAHEKFPWDRCRTADRPLPEHCREYGLGHCPDHQVVTQPCGDKIHKEDMELADWCERCHGLGQIALTRCPTCGKQDVHPDLVYRPCLQPMGEGMFLQDRYDDLIRGLPGVRLAPLLMTDEGRDPPICFRFDGGEGMAMPCLPAEEGDIDRYPRVDR